MPDQSADDISELQRKKLDESATLDRHALDVVVALLLAQFPSLFDVTGIVTSAADWLVN